MRSFLVLIFFSASIFAQVNVDSLKQVLKTNRAFDHENILGEISSYYLAKGHLDSAKKYSRKIIELGGVNKNDSTLANGYFKLSAPYIIDEKFDSALTYLNQAESISKKINSQRLYGRVLANGAVVYGRLGDYQKAINQLTTSLEIFKEIKDSLQIAVGLGNIAFMYYNLGYYKTSSEFISKSILISEKIGDKVGVGFMQRQMGNNLEEMHKYSEALRRYSAALEIFKSENENPEIGNTFVEIARIYKKQNNYDAASRFLRKAEDTFEKFNLSYGIISVMKEYSEILIAQKDYKKALEYEKKIHDYYKRSSLKSELTLSYLRMAAINFNLDNQNESEKFFNRAEELIPSLNSLTIWEKFYKAKSDFYRKYKNYKLAFKNHEKLLVIKDSILSKEISAQVNDLQIKYSSSEKQKENDLLTAQNKLQQKEVEEQKLIRNSIIIFIVILLIFGILLIVRYFRILKLTRELNKANATLNKFFSIVSHDLKNLFYGQLSYTDLIVSDINSLSREELHEHLLTVQNSVKKSVRFTENLFNWSMSQQNQISLKSEEIQIEKLIDDAIELYKNSAASKNILLVKSIPSNFTFNSDLETIKTVIRNLTNNAIKFSKENGVIKFSAEKMNGNVNITVEDNGVGIHSENIPYLFSLEKNISTEGTAKEKGSGLGLILCKEFIEKNNGSIDVQSKVGEGSKFIITLPS